MAAGGVTAVRGSTAPLEEVGHIITHADCVGLVVENNEALARLVPLLTKVIVVCGCMDTNVGMLHMMQKDACFSASCSLRRGCGCC